METYPEMNNKIKDILRINSDNPVDLYAAQRIEDLESDLKAVTAQRDKAIEEFKKHISPYNGKACKICKRNNIEGCKECNFEWIYNGLEAI